MGETVDEAVYLFGALDRLCQVQLMVEAAAANENIPKTLISKEDAEYTANSINESRRNYIRYLAISGPQMRSIIFFSEKNFSSNISPTVLNKPEGLSSSEKRMETDDICIISANLDCTNFF